ncbi:MAG: hypothetical protein V3R87_09610, partial [Dehalococcoidia bacterium]
MSEPWVFYDISLENDDLDYIEERREEIEAVSRAAGGNVGQILTDIIRLYPDLNPEIATGLALSGVPADHPITQEIALEQARHDSSIMETIFKGTVRIGITVLDTIPDTLSTALRTGVYMFGGSDEHSFMAPWSALTLAGPGDSVFAVSQFLQGKPVDLGAGFLPEGTPVEERENYKQFILDGMDPIAAKAKSIREQGWPVRETARALRSGGNVRGVPGASPGQLFVLGTGWIPGPLRVDPGTREFELVSGMADAAWRIAEPSNALMKMAMFEARAVRMFHGVENAIPSQYTSFFRAEQLLPSNRVGLRFRGSATRNQELLKPGSNALNTQWDAGRLVGPRSTVNAQSLREWSGTPDGKKFFQAAVDNDDFLTTMKMFKGQTLATDRSFLGAVTDSKNADEIFSLMGNQIQSRGRLLKKPVQTSLTSSIAARSPMLQRAAEGDFGGVARALSPARTVSRKLGAAFGGTGKGGVAISEAQAATGEMLGEFGGLRAGLRESSENTEWTHLFKEMAGYGLSTENLDKGLQQLDDFLIQGGFNTADRSKFLRTWADLPKGAKQDEAWQVLSRVLAELELKMIKKGIPPNIARHVSGVFNDLEEMKVYFGEQLFGDPAFFTGTEFKNGRPSATQHIMTEFMQS